MLHTHIFILMSRSPYWPTGALLLGSWGIFVRLVLIGRHQWEESLVCIPSAFVLSRRPQVELTPGRTSVQTPGKNRLHYINKAFQSNANRPQADRCRGYTVNKFEHVRGMGGRGHGEIHVAQVWKGLGVGTHQGWGGSLYGRGGDGSGPCIWTRLPWTDRHDTTENITFP